MGDILQRIRSQHRIARLKSFVPIVGLRGRICRTFQSLRDLRADDNCTFSVSYVMLCVKVRGYWMASAVLLGTHVVAESRRSAQTSAQSVTEFAESHQLDTQTPSCKQLEPRYIRV